MTTYGSLFSGAGGFELGFHAAGLECKWMSEIEPKARIVLQHHWPEVPLYEDIRDMNGFDLEPVDIIVGGFPCQDLSQAGKRKGFGGNRSSLFHEYVRLVREMRNATDGIFPRWALWENVFGLLSMRNGELDIIYSSWAEIGAVVQEHRVLDTGRAFGIPQRRRRVLGAVGFDPRAERCGEILLVKESLSRNTKESIEKEPESSREPDEEFRGGSPTGRGSISALTQALGAGGPDDNMAQAGHIVPVPDKDHTGTITNSWYKGPGNVQMDEGILVPVAFAENQRAEIVESDHIKSISQPGGKPGQGYPAIAFHPTQDPINSESHSHALSAQSTAAVTDQKLRPRKLTPVECERLMGWPDFWTEPAGKDTPRYKLIGNGVTAPAAEWLATKILEAETRIDKDRLQ